MKKLLTVSLTLLSYVVSAQDTEATDIQKMVADKSFVFVSTAVFSDANYKSYNPYDNQVYNVFYTNPSFNYQGKISYPNQMETVALMSQRAPLTDQMPKIGTDQFPVIYFDQENVTLHPSLLVQSWRDPMNLDPESVNTPLIYTNYSARKTKKGYWVINFKVDYGMAPRLVNMKVAPDGTAEMMITLGGGTSRSKQYFKGSLKELSRVQTEI